MFSKIRNRYLRAFCKFLASLRLAVFVLLGIAGVSAYGTIVESQYDAVRAQKLVYHSWWAYTIFALLAVNLAAVMVDRLPWKRRHFSFLMAHIGILMLLGGSLLTRNLGIDGIMRLGISETVSYVTLPNEEITLWAGGGISNLVPLLDKPLKVDFLVHPPSRSRPLEVLPGKLKVLEYMPYVLRDVKVEPSDLQSDGPALRFVLENDRASVTDWMILNSANPMQMVEMGPAKVIFAKDQSVPAGGNSIVLVPEGGGVKYTIFTESKGSRKSGFLKAGQSVNTGWMDLNFRLLNYHERARYNVKYVPIQRPTPASVSAIVVEFNGKEFTMGLNSNLRLFDDEMMYLLGYGNTRLQLGWGITLKDFRVGRYQGTMRAASYESLVEVPLEPEQRNAAGEDPKREVLISMNEPLKFRGLTFYQSSFEENESGVPTHSILSVNYDPGRWWKYLGSLFVVIGSASLFYRKARTAPVMKS